MTKDITTAKSKSLTQQHKKSCIQWRKKHKCWSSVHWNKFIFSDESHVCLGTGDNPGIFVWRRADKKFKDCLKTKAKYQCSIMV